ncbi:MAG: YciI family protein [Phycisphaerales bacterium]|nr:YciI family protein [Phycisphaerales bacterium]
MRFLGLLKADKDSEAGVPPSPDFMERCGTFMEEVSRKGILVATDGLLPSAHGKRVRVAGGKSTVIDGPFTESKELVASYAILEAKDIDEAVYWTRRFLEVLGGGECEIRPIMSAEACGGGCHSAQNPAAAATR